VQKKTTFRVAAVVSAIASFMTRTLTTIFSHTGIGFTDDGTRDSHRRVTRICLLYLCIAAWDEYFDEHTNVTDTDFGGCALHAFCTSRWTCVSSCHFVRLDPTGPDSARRRIGIKPKLRTTGICVGAIDDGLQVLFQRADVHAYVGSLMKPYHQRTEVV
jgi:hypothetical protein